MSDTVRFGENRLHSVSEAWEVVVDDNFRWLSVEKVSDSVDSVGVGGFCDEDVFNAFGKLGESGNDCEKVAHCEGALSNVVGVDGVEQLR